MGRKPKIEPKAMVKAMDNVVQNIEEQRLSIQEVEEQFGDGQPYERLRLVNEIRFYQQQTAESLIEIGKRLIRIKANEEHGGFLQVLESLGMAARSAQYAISAAKKFGNTQATAYLGNEKIRALTVLDDDSIQTLENGGEVKGVSLDDIEKMSVRELKEALRKERDKHKKDKTAQEDAIAKKEEKINDLEREIRYRDKPTKETLAGARLDEELKPFTFQLHDAIFAMNRCLDIITGVQRIEGIAYTQLNAWILKQSDDIANITETFTELQDAINDIHIDKADEEKREKITYA